MAVVRSWPRVLVATDQPSSSWPDEGVGGQDDVVEEDLAEVASGRPSGAAPARSPPGRACRPRSTTGRGSRSGRRRCGPGGSRGRPPGPSDVHTFWPDTTHRPSGCGRARVRMAPRSEPASGSLKSWHQIVSAERMPGRSACWSGVPCSIRVGPTMLRPIVLTGSGAPASAQVTRNSGVLGQRGAAAAVLGRPVDPDPAALRAAPAARPGAARRPRLRLRSGRPSGSVSELLGEVPVEPGRTARPGRPDQFGGRRPGRPAAASRSALVGASPRAAESRLYSSRWMMWRWISSVPPPKRNTRESRNMASTAVPCS